MANRYWINGTGNWSDTNHWSTSSGGSSGASVPTSSDDVFVDSNSGLSGGTITLSITHKVNSIVSNSGFLYTIDSSGSGVGFEVNGSIVFESGITLIGGYFNFVQTTSGNTITTSNVDMGYISIVGVGGEIMLLDDLISSSSFYQENGTFDANNHNVTADDFYFYADTGYTPTVIMGSGTWSGGYWQIDENSGATVNIVAETSTIKQTEYNEVFYGKGKTYYNLWITGDEYYVEDSNIFNDIKIDAGLTVWFKEGTTQTVNTFTVTGTDGNTITLDTDTGTGQFILSKSFGKITCDYVDIKNSKAIGGAIWSVGTHSTNSGNNSGWNFWKALTKPSGTIYTNQNFSGKEQFDDANVLFDDPNVFFDGVNNSQYSTISKPVGTSYTKV